MYKELVKALRHCIFGDCRDCDYYNNCANLTREAADAIEELQTTLCNWCAVCHRDKRDLSTCEIYESCRAEPPKEE